MRTAPKNPKEEPAGAPAAEAAPAEAEKPTKREKPEKTEKGAKGKEGKGKAAKPAAPGGVSGKARRKPIPDNPNFRYIVRVAGSDLDGQRATAMALTGVRGVGVRIAEAACRLAQVDPMGMIGNLPEAAVDGIEALIGRLPREMPLWMINHRTDRTTGESLHYFGSDVETSRRDDVNVMKMIRSYRGVRHERGQKVRGQRTRSNGRTGMAAGVLKKVAKEAAQAKAKEAEAAGEKKG